MDAQQKLKAQQDFNSAVYALLVAVGAAEATKILRAAAKLIAPEKIAK